MSTNVILKKKKKLKTLNNLTVFDNLSFIFVLKSVCLYNERFKSLCIYCKELLSDLFDYGEGYIRDNINMKEVQLYILKVYSIHVSCFISMIEIK